MLNLRRFKTTHITRRVNAAKAPGSLIGGRYNPPQSMSKRTALRWSLIGPAKTKTKDPLGKDISKTPIDLSGKIYTPNSTKKYTSKVITHTITLEESGQTISKLAQNYFKLQANACRFQILRGEIYASGSMNARSLDASPKATLVAGDKLNRCVRYIESKALAPTSLKSEQLDAIKSMIIYKDENILVINKKPSIAMHAGTNHSTYNLESIMKSLTLYSGDEDLRLVHRLDKDTTGCLIFARTKKAAVELSEMFKSRSDDSRITTRYTALVMGKIDANEYSSGSSHTIITGITTFGEAPNQRQKIVNWHKDFTNMKENEVKKAVTIIKILQSKGQFSLVELEPRTGRKHQLRLHCTQLKTEGNNTYIYGDYKYGSVASNTTKGANLHLHCSQVHIRDWFGVGSDLNLHCGVSDEFMMTLKKFGMHKPEFKK